MPWAGLLAVAIVVALDLCVASPGFPWASLVSRVEPEQSVYWGVTRDRAELARVGAQEDAIRIAVLGSSRGHTGFLHEEAERVLPGTAIAQLSHALQDPATVHALVPELIEAGLDVVVLTMSHVDTHRPVRLEPLPAKSTARVATLAPLFEVAGASWLFENRETAYRIAAAELSNLYRFRDNFGRAGLNRLREFPLDERLEGPRRVNLLGPAAIGVGGPARLVPEREIELLDEVLPHQRKWPRQLGWYREVRDGPHVSAQALLLAGAVDDLVAAGVAVVVAECPIHEIGLRVQQPGAQAAFRGFAAQLGATDGVFNLPLDPEAPYPMTDFYDLFHLNESGAARFTAEVVGFIAREVLPELRAQSRSAP